MAPTPTTVVGRTFATAKMEPTGIITGAAYADLDSMGIAFCFPVPVSGVIMTAEYFDLDDEGLQVDLLLFEDNPGLQTDNGAVTLVTRDIINALGRVQFTAFADYTNGQKSTVTNVGLAYVLQSRNMWAILQARGALNIAAGKKPLVRLTILADE